MELRYDERLAAQVTDDAHLIEQIQSGDVQAFELLVDRYEQRVYAACLRMVGETQASDVTQEVFLAAYRAIQRYHGASRMAWLLRIARNKCINYLRARGCRATLSLDWAITRSDAVARRAPSGEDPEQRVLRAELACSLERMI